MSSYRASRKPLRIAVVCSSNQNRSMEAHNILKKKGYCVESFGSGNHVKLPGAAANQPNIYEFCTTYDEMIVDLERKDKSLYTINGLLHMLQRNRRIKPHPERFQDDTRTFDLIITCEERVFDQVVEEMVRRDAFIPPARGRHTSVHIINVDIQDNHDEAIIGALNIHELIKRLEASQQPIEEEIGELLQEYEKDFARKNVLYSMFIV